MTHILCSNRAQTGRTWSATASFPNLCPDFQLRTHRMPLITSHRGWLLLGSCLHLLHASHLWSGPLEASVSSTRKLPSSPLARESPPEAGGVVSRRCAREPAPVAPHGRPTGAGGTCYFEISTGCTNNSHSILLLK